MLKKCQFNMHIHVITPLGFGNRRSKDIKVCSLWYLSLVCFLRIPMYINYNNFFFFGGRRGAKWAGLCIWISEFSNAQRHAIIVYNEILELENATPPPWLRKSDGFFFTAQKYTGLCEWKHNRLVKHIMWWNGTSSFII